MLFALIAIALVFLGGCANPPLSVYRGPAPVLERFAVEYALNEGGVLKFRLEDPKLVMDRDGERRWAYALVNDQGEGFVVIYYLDASLRVVRVDAPCIDRDDRGVCQFYRVDWRYQGLLPPVGIGLLWHLGRGSAVDYSFWNMAHSIVPTVTQDGDVVDVSLSDYGARAYSVLELNGRFRFRSGQVTPFEFVLPRHPDVPWLAGYRVSYEALGSMSREADVWPKSIEFPAPAPRQGLMFPGEERDDFGVGVSHRGAVEGFLRSNDEARASAERGCIVNYNLGFPSRPSSGLLPTTETETNFRTSIVDEGKEEAVRWTFTRRRTVLEETYSGKSDDTFDVPGGCAAVNRSPWPSVNSAQFLDAAKTVPISHQGKMNFVYGRSPPRLVPFPPETGWDKFYLQYIPAYVDLNSSFALIIPYTIEMNANLGWFEQVKVHPADVARMDEGQVQR